MNYIEYAKEGLLNLYFFKLRSILALLGVVVGTASVVAMVLGGELATNEALKQFKSLGTDLLAVTINVADDKRSVATGKMDNLTLQQAQAVSAVDQVIVQVAPYTQLFHPIYYNGNSINGMILGVTDHFGDMVNIKLIAGRFISLLDKFELYCVLGRGIYQQMKTISFKEPLGERIQIGRQIYTIVGVADTWQENSFVYANIDESILVPLLASTTMSEHAAINHLILKLAPHTAVVDLEKKVKNYLDFLLPGKQIAFRSAKELIAKMENQSTILTVFLGLIGSVSLIVGGIGVMNIMLVSVRERRREIGIRMAVGATGYDIGALFLMEAVILSIFGGLLGVIVGIAIAYIIALIWHWQFTLFIWPPLAGFSVSVFVGIFFGFYPAYLATKLNPIDALRSD